MVSSDPFAVLREYSDAISDAEAEAAFSDGDLIGRGYMDLFMRVKALVQVRPDCDQYLDELSEMFNAYVGDADTAAVYILKVIKQHHANRRDGSGASSAPGR